MFLDSHQKHLHAISGPLWQVAKNSHGKLFKQVCPLFPILCPADSTKIQAAETALPTGAQFCGILWLEGASQNADWRVLCQQIGHSLASVFFLWPRAGAALFFESIFHTHAFLDYVLGTRAALNAWHISVKRTNLSCLMEFIVFLRTLQATILLKCFLHFYVLKCTKNWRNSAIVYLYALQVNLPVVSAL